MMIPSGMTGIGGGDRRTLLRSAALSSSSAASMDRHARMMEQMHLGEVHDAYNRAGAGYPHGGEPMVPPQLPPRILSQSTHARPVVLPVGHPHAQLAHPHEPQHQFHPGIAASGGGTSVIPPYHHRAQHAHTRSLGHGPTFVPTQEPGSMHIRHFSLNQLQEHDLAMMDCTDGDAKHRGGAGSKLPGHMAPKYECQYCGKRFTRPSSLKIHLHV